MSDRLRDTLAAVERGEKPRCPFCSAEYQGGCIYGESLVSNVVVHAWQCDTSIPVKDNVSPARGARCYERELAALREDYKTKCGELAYAHAEYQRIEGALREEIARLKREDAELSAQNQALWAGVAQAMFDQLSGKEDA